MRTYDHNGETREIGFPDASDEQLAAILSMFNDLPRETILAARDRILCLAKEKAELWSANGSLQGQVANANRAITELAQQRDELAKVLKRVDAMYGHMFDTTDGRGFLSDTSLAKFDEIMGDVNNVIAKLEGVPK